MHLSLKINGAAREVDCDPGDALFDVLRRLGLTSVKQGCDREGTCGACTVLLDGEPVLSCILPAAQAVGRAVLTVEGLGHPGAPHPIQQAYVDAGAVQCGYCTPGLVLATKALLDRVPEPTAAQIADGLSGSLCRCTGYVKILEAVRVAAVTLNQERAREPR